MYYKIFHGINVYYRTSSATYKPQSFNDLEVCSKKEVRNW